MGQIIGRSAKPDACNLRSLSSFGTPGAGQHILVSTDNSAMQNGQGNFDAYVVGDGHTAATALELHPLENEMVTSHPVVEGAGCYKGSLKLSTTQYLTPLLPINTTGTSAPNTIKWKGGVMSDADAIVIYDAGGNRLDYYSANADERTITSAKIPNARYFRAGFPKENLKKCYVQDSDGNFLYPIKHPATASIVESEKEIDTLNRVDEVLFDGIDGILEDSSLLQGGGVTVYEGMMISPYIYIGDGMRVLTFNTGFVSTAYGYLCLYDKDKNYVNYYASNAANRKVFVKDTYIRFSFLADAEDVYIMSDDKILFQWNSKIKKYRLLGLIDEIENSPSENYNNPISSGGLYDFLHGKQINRTLIEGKYLNTSYNPVSNADWGYTDYIPAKVGDTIKSVFGADHTSQSGFTCVALYDAEKAHIGMWTTNGYNYERDGMTIGEKYAATAYIRCNIYLPEKQNCGIWINGERVWGYARDNSGLLHRIDVDESKLSQLENDISELEKGSGTGRLSLPLLSLVNSDTNGGKIRDNATFNDLRVVTKSAMCFPKMDKTWHVKIPDGYKLFMWMGKSNSTGFVSSELVGDGETISTEGFKLYRIVVRKTDNTQLSAAEVKAFVDNGTLDVWTEDNGEADVITRNAYKETAIGGLKRILLPTLADNGMNSMPVFAHISDLHGDVQRLKNCLDYCDYIHPDALLASGDTVTYVSNDYGNYQVDLAVGHNTDYLFCIGNHEANGSVELYSTYMQELAGTYGYLKSDGVTTDACYWYKDFADKKIRVIALNYYEGCIYRGCLGQSQIDWFINTLSSTPIGYGILVMLHSPEDKVVVNSPYDVFRQKHREFTFQENGFFVGDRPIMHIVDAFIGRTTYTGSYTESTEEEVTINADFSGVDASTEFIAYICGHRHEDWIGYYEKSTHKQLCLDITTGNAMYGDSTNPAWSNQSDLPRGGEGVCQDAFNVYAIDRAGGSVKIVRVGSDITETFEERKMMTIPYRD